MSDSLRPQWTVAHQAPLSMEFSRHEYWSGLPFPSPRDLPNPRIKPQPPALLADSLLPELPGKTLGFPGGSEGKVYYNAFLMDVSTFILAFYFFFLIFDTTASMRLLKCKLVDVTLWLKYLSDFQCLQGKTWKTWSYLPDSTGPSHLCASPFPLFSWHSAPAKMTSLLFP